SALDDGARRGRLGLGLLHLADARVERGRELRLPVLRDEPRRLEDLLELLLREALLELDRAREARVVHETETLRDARDQLVALVEHPRILSTIGVERLEVVRLLPTHGLDE